MKTSKIQYTNEGPKNTVRLSMPSLISILLFTAFMCVAAFGGICAVHPYLAYVLPALPDNMSQAQYAQILRELYPDYWLDPARFVYGHHWPLAEMWVRFGAVSIGFVLIFAFIIFIRREKRVA
jgi:hypothetical protein